MVGDPFSMYSTARAMTGTGMIVPPIETTVWITVNS